ncbi:MAG: hypothetical protein K2L02_01035 [Clostridia bacterium]|nr:hypothetical protein [Clostridia bacterium]
MIIGDTFEAPAEKTTLLRLSAKELLQKHRRRAFHLREDGDGLVVAEGEEQYFKLPLAATGIAAVPGKIFGHDPQLKKLYLMKPDLSAHEVSYSSTPEPYRVLRVFSTKGAMELYGVTKTEVLCYKGNTTNHVGSNKGGYGAFFRERLFTASGTRVYYSVPFNAQSWTEKRYGGGYLDFNSDELGDILGMQSYKDKLYLFRKQGITSLRVLGDELNFRAVHMPMKCGRLIENTVALCGEKVGYFTDRGFYLFNGAVSELAQDSRFDEIDFTKFYKVTSYCGRYYALVTKKQGGASIYCYDPEQKEAHFIENGAVDIASGDELYFTKGGYAYRVTERGVSENFTPYFTAEKIAFGIGNEKMLRSIAIDGEGTFTIEISSNRGKCTVKGSANKILKLRSPVLGNGFDIKISVGQQEADKARFRAVLFRFTEEKE